MKMFSSEHPPHAEALRSGLEPSSVLFSSKIFISELPTHAVLDKPEFPISIVEYPGTEIEKFEEAVLLLGVNPYGASAKTSGGAGGGGLGGLGGGGLGGLGGGDGIVSVKAVVPPHPTVYSR